MFWKSNHWWATWPLWFVISNFCNRFFLLLKPQDHVRFARAPRRKQISVEQSIHTPLRKKDWEPNTGKSSPASCGGLQVCRFEGHILELSCRNTSWEDAPQLWANPLVPDLALKFSLPTAELGEVMLTWCHFSVNHLKDTREGFGRNETQKTWEETSSFDLCILLEELLRKKRPDLGLPPGLSIKGLDDSKGNKLLRWLSSLTHPFWVSQHLGVPSRASSNEAYCYCSAG